MAALPPLLVRGSQSWGMPWCSGYWCLLCSAALFCRASGPFPDRCPPLHSNCNIRSLTSSVCRQRPASCSNTKSGSRCSSRYLCICTVCRQSGHGAGTYSGEPKMPKSTFRRSTCSRCAMQAGRRHWGLGEGTEPRQSRYKGFLLDSTGPPGW